MVETFVEIVGSTKSLKDRLYHGYIVGMLKSYDW